MRKDWDEMSALYENINTKKNDKKLIKEAALQELPVHTDIPEGEEDIEGDIGGEEMPSIPNPDEKLIYHLVVRKHDGTIIFNGKSDNLVDFEEEVKDALNMSRKVGAL
jgi:hypothetical protein